MIRFFRYCLVWSRVNAHADQAAILDKDYRIMMAWFRVSMTISSRCTLKVEQGIDEALRHERLYPVFTPADLPAFGDHVFYVQQHLNDDPSEIYRQRIYSFRADYDRNAIRLTIHIPNES